MFRWLMRRRIDEARRNAEDALIHDLRAVEYDRLGDKDQAEWQRQEAERLRKS